MLATSWANFAGPMMMQMRVERMKDDLSYEKGGTIGSIEGNKVRDYGLPCAMYSSSTKSTTRPSPGQSSADVMYEIARPYSFSWTNV